ncbi:MAG: hypothetical protein ACD_47C00709G0001 [uncultured bacterium]|nr:MAG: hypothetical protein ACD_47C00709G0001 [uncultured bacterium]
MLMKLRTIQLSSSLYIRPLINIGMRAGTRVIESRETAIRANVFVKASGWNILPSMPDNAKTGRKDITIISTAKNIGLPTILHGSISISVVSPLIWPSGNFRCSA